MLHSAVTKIAAPRTGSAMPRPFDQRQQRQREEKRQSFQHIVLGAVQPGRHHRHLWRTVAIADDGPDWKVLHSPVEPGG